MEEVTMRFLSERFTFLKPAFVKDTLPSCCDISRFHKNALAQPDDILPYAAYGGIISFDRNVDLNITTRNEYLCIYVSEGRISFASDSCQAIGEKKLVFVGYRNKTYNIKTISKVSSIYIYFVSGATADSYVNTLRSSADSQSYFHKEFDMHDFIVHSLSKLNELIAGQEEVALFTESLIFQYVFVRLLHVQKKAEEGDENIPYIHKLKKLLDTRYAEYLTLDLLQEELNINKYRLCRDFSATYHISPLKYLNSVRINTARQMLLDTDHSVVEIGNAVGIPNTTHFIRLFKKETGDTPLKYRQHHSTLGDNLPGPYSF